MCARGSMAGFDPKRTSGSSGRYSCSSRGPTTGAPTSHPPRARMTHFATSNLLPIDWGKCRAGRRRSLVRDCGVQALVESLELTRARLVVGAAGACRLPAVAVGSASNWCGRADSNPRHTDYKSRLRNSWQYNPTASNGLGRICLLRIAAEHWRLLTRLSQKCPKFARLPSPRTLGIAMARTLLFIILSSFCVLVNADSSAPQPV